MRRFSRRWAVGLGALALVMASARSVSADNVTGSTAFNNNGLSITANSNNSTIKFANGSFSSIGTTAGSFTSSTTPGFSTAGLANNQPFTTFCVDLGQYTSSNAYSAVISLSSASGQVDQSNNSRNIGAAGWVVDNFANQSNATLLGYAHSINSGVTSLSQNEILAGLQMAIWKAAYNANTDLTNSSGGNGLWFTGTAASDLGALSLAQYIVNNLGSNYEAAIFLDYSIKSSSNQDQIAAFATPEPSTLAISGLGALGFLVYGLRRKRA